MSWWGQGQLAAPQEAMLPAEQPVQTTPLLALRNHLALTLVKTGFSLSNTALEMATVGLINQNSYRKEQENIFH